jgi:hypothetical protein
VGAQCSTVCLSMYSITENIYYSQPSSIAILLQPEPNCFTSYNTRKALCSLSLSLSLSLCYCLPLPPTCLLLMANEARSYFVSTIKQHVCLPLHSVSIVKGVCWLARSYNQPMYRCSTFVVCSYISGWF